MADIEQTSKGLALMLVPFNIGIQEHLENLVNLVQIQLKFMVRLAMAGYKGKFLL